MPNSYFVVHGEVGAVTTLLKRSQRSASNAVIEESVKLLRNFADLRDVLSNLYDMSGIRPDAFLQPFLDVIKSPNTNDVVTSRALLSIDKFIKRGLIPCDDRWAPSAVESIAVAVTETKFADSDYNKGDGVVFRMVGVLESLLSAECGQFLTNERVCNMLNALFGICFGSDISPDSLLRMAAETALGDMTCMIFQRIPTFTHEGGYGLSCARELLRFAVSLTNPLDKANTEHMVVVGLNLVTVGLESAIDGISGYPILLPIIKDELSKNVLQLLNSPNIYIFSMANRVCFLLFESLRSHLKFQMETYFKALTAIVGSETSKYDRKEMALESVVQLFKIPGLVGELYLNFDCGLYCSNLFEDLVKMLSENSFPTSGHILPTHILSLDAMLTVIKQICAHCAPNMGSDVRSCASDDESQMAARIPTLSEIIDKRKRKRLITEATELFNKKPKEGIQFLCEKGVWETPDPPVIARWLRENPHLEKTKIAECICDRKNGDVLKAFVETFPFEGKRLDEALRLFLEAFRLQGESAEIEKIMEHFAQRYLHANKDNTVAQFIRHPDAAFILSYQIIMLNTDQHNPQVRRNQQPMSLESFKRNLAGTNSGGDFDPEMLEQIYTAIKNEEIVMPAEQTGAVRENYLWKILQERSSGPEGRYVVGRPGCNDRDLFNTLWGPATAALSYIFERSDEKSTLSKTLNGYGNCAVVAAYYDMTDVFDNLVIHLCKFSTLMVTENRPDSPMSESASDSQYRRGNGSNTGATAPEQMVYAFGENYKAQISTKLMFELIHKHGDTLRAGWKNVIGCILQLFRMQILPHKLTMVDDFVDPRGQVTIQRPPVKKTQSRQETAVLRWLGGFVMSSDSSQQNKPTPEQEQLKKTVVALINECRPDELIAGGRHLTSSSLNELIASIVHFSFVVCGAVSHDDQSSQLASAEELAVIDTKNVVLSRDDEDEVAFLLELMISILLESKYRMPQIWPIAKRHFTWILSGFGRNLFVVERAVVGLLRVANRNLKDQEEKPIAGELLSSISLISDMSPPALFYFSRQIAHGLHQLLYTNAANIHELDHWEILFTLLQSVGAASYRQLEAKIASTDDIHDAHILEVGKTQLQRQNPVLAWKQRNPHAQFHMNPGHFFDTEPLMLLSDISRHDVDAFLKVCETLHFLIGGGAVHITPFNFDACTECLRAMIEASLDGENAAAMPIMSNTSGYAASSAGSIVASDLASRPTTPDNSSIVLLGDTLPTSPNSGGGNGEPTTIEQQQQLIDQQSLQMRYELASMQLAGLCAAMIAKCVEIQEQAADGSDDSYRYCVLPIFSEAFRMRVIPLLQALARLACDSRRKVRETAFGELQAVCLTLQTTEMQLIDWEQLFGRVVFPLLRNLRSSSSGGVDAIAAEELGVRIVQWAIRMTLNQLETLCEMPAFSVLVVRLIAVMENYVRSAQSDLPAEAIPQSLKNMVQVLDNSRVFDHLSLLREEVKKRLDTFVPEMAAEIFTPPPPLLPPQQQPLVTQQSAPPQPVASTSVSPPPTASPSTTSSPVHQPQPIAATISAPPPTTLHSSSPPAAGVPLSRPIVYTPPITTDVEDDKVVRIVIPE